MSATATKSVLRNIGTATVDASTTPFNKYVFGTRVGLYVFDSFFGSVRKHAKPMESMGALALSYSDLEEDATDSQIGAALGDGYEFSETEVCYAIHCLVIRQPKGEVGDLLTSGTNYFYVKGGPVVCVYWNSHFSEWCVADTSRDEICRERGVRFFRP